MGPIEAAIICLILCAIAVHVLIIRWIHRINIRVRLLAEIRNELHLLNSYLSSAAKA